MAALEVKGKGEEGMRQEVQVLCPCQPHHVAEMSPHYDPQCRSGKAAIDQISQE